VASPAEERGRLLVVDDEPGARDSLEAILSTECEVDAVSTVEDARKALAMATYDVVVTDYEMPGASGLALLRFVHFEHRNTVGILVTGHGEYSDVRAASGEEHVFAVLLKPYDPEVLLYRVRTAVAVSRMRRALARMRRPRSSVSLARRP
jgi:two-component system response regulator PilR (NtrC family)